MSNLERFIERHRPEFDEAEPSEGHFARFEALLADEPVVLKQTGRKKILSIAAAILLLIGSSAIIFDYSAGKIRNAVSGGDDLAGLPGEVREALRYYDARASQQMAILGKMSGNGTDVTGSLNSVVLQDIRNLDATTAELKRELAGQPDDERLMAAIIRNQQMKEAILKTIIDKVTIPSSY